MVVNQRNLCSRAGGKHFMTGDSNPRYNHLHRSQITAPSDMALRAGMLLLLFLGCSLSPIIFAQTVNEAITVAFNISAADPDIVQKHAQEVINAVRILTDQVNSLTMNLTNANSTDYTHLQSLIQDITDLSKEINVTRGQYDLAVSQKNGINQTLQNISDTLTCFSKSNCVTGGPTTSPFTGTTTFNPCSSNPCQNGGTCTPVVGNYICNCAPPYTGHNCENAVCDPPTNQVLVAQNATWQSLSSTRFPQLLGGLNCTWRIRGPPGQNVNITIQNVTFAGSGNIFQVFDVDNNVALFSTSETTTTTVTVATTNSSSTASVYFNTALLGASGAFQIQYSSVPSDPCVTQNYSCGENGTCFANGFIPECRCKPCYNGPRCQIYDGDPCAPFAGICQNNGTCEFDPDTCNNARCNCTGTSHSGPFCNLPPFRYYKLYDTPNTDE